MPVNRELRERCTDAVHAAASGPSPEDLQEAPLLDGWIAVAEITGNLCLLGKVEGHPSIGSGTISTSPLMKIDPEAGYARTVSRWYRLGRPMSETDPDHALYLASPQCLRWCPIPDSKIDELAGVVMEGIQMMLRKAPYDA